MVPKKGLEPPHPCEYMDLNHARLPIPPLRHYQPQPGTLEDQLSKSRKYRPLCQLGRLNALRACRPVAVISRGKKTEAREIPSLSLQRIRFQKSGKLFHQSLINAKWISLQTGQPGRVGLSRATEKLRKLYELQLRAGRADLPGCGHASSDRVRQRRTF